jgi:uncharacterized protein YbjT (DUF2867 family)
LRPALAGVDAVFLLGAGIRGQAEREINVVNAAKAAGVRRLVKLSVWSAPAEQFGLVKIHRAVEREVEASGLTGTFLRSNGFMQNFAQHMAGSIKSQGAIYQPAGDAKISHIDARDVARVAARALTTRGHEAKAYELSGPQALSYDEAADILSRVLDRRISYVALSDDAAKAGMLAAGMPDFYADHMLDLFRAYRTGVVTGDGGREGRHRPRAAGVRAVRPRLRGRISLKARRCVSPIDDDGLVAGALRPIVISKPQRSSVSGRARSQEGRLRCSFRSTGNPTTSRSIRTRRCSGCYATPWG